MPRESEREIAGEKRTVRWGDYTSFYIEVAWEEETGDNYRIELPIHPQLDRDHPDKKRLDNRNDVTLDIIQEAVEHILDERAQTENPSLNRATVIEKTEIRKIS